MILPANGPATFRANSRTRIPSSSSAISPSVPVRPPTRCEAPTSAAVKLRFALLHERREALARIFRAQQGRLERPFGLQQRALRHVERALQDRKSTRLNSSHVKSSYAVLCFKKKT